MFKAIWYRKEGSICEFDLKNIEEKDETDTLFSEPIGDKHRHQNEMLQN
jgi:hypothetical protein